MMLTAPLILIVVTSTYFSALSFRDLYRSFFFWQRTLILGSLMGALMGMTGFWLLARQEVFTGLALCASAGWGILMSSALISVFLASPTHSESVVYLMAVALALGLHTFIRLLFAKRFLQDVTTAVLYIVATAGLILSADWVPQGHHETGNLLFGNSVSVLDEDWSLGLPFAVLLMGLGIGWRPVFVSLIFDAEGFRLIRFRHKTWNAFLQGFILLSLILSAKILGMLTTFSLALFAPLAAWPHFTSARASFFSSVWFGILLFPAGFALSFFADLPTGACIAAAGFILAIASLILEKAIKRFR